MDNNKINTGATICLLFMVVSMFAILFSGNHISSLNSDILFSFWSICPCLGAIFLAVEWGKTKRFDVMRPDAIGVSLYTIVFAVLTWFVNSIQPIDWNWAKMTWAFCFTFGGIIMVVGIVGDFIQTLLKKKICP